MTIAAVWVRTLESGAEELIFCSDSRLCNGKRFDQGQKTFRFERGDAAICFAGGTDWAYPMIVSAVKAAEIHFPTKTRALSISKFKSHLIRILNQMQDEVHTYVKGEEIPDVTFIFGGYDWLKKSFRIWSIKFEKREGCFRASERKGSNRFGGLGKIEFAGDLEWVSLFRKNLKALCQSRYGLGMNQPHGSKFNYEPFEVIRDLLKEIDAGKTIGGAPQGVKVYQFQNSVDIGFFWPTLEGRLFLSGRPILEYERATIRSVVDPDSLNSTWSNGTVVDAFDQLRKACQIDQARKSDEYLDAIETSS